MRTAPPIALALAAGYLTVALAPCPPVEVPVAAAPPEAVETAPAPASHDAHAHHAAHAPPRETTSDRLAYTAPCRCGCDQRSAAAPGVRPLGFALLASAPPALTADPAAPPVVDAPRAPESPVPGLDPIPI